VYLCFKRWGGRLVAAYVYDPTTQDATEVIGQPVANPAQESDEEDADNLRCSAFKDRWATSVATNTQYVDMDYALTPPVPGSNYWEFVSQDGQIRKRMTLPSGRDTVQAQYTLASGIGTLYVRHGFGPNQLDLLHYGDTNLIVQSDNTYYGLSNAMGGAVYAVCDVNCQRSTNSLPNAGYQNREFPLIEQVEQYNAGNATNFTMWLAFSPASGVSVDGDGVPNWWRLQYFGHITGSAADSSRGSDDADGDGMTNLQEYLAGTNPKDRTSVFKIANVTPVPASGQVITWNSVSGKAYTVFSCDDMATQNWQPLTNGNLVAVGSSASCTDAPPSNVAQRFYRVRVNP
jgi:hypothetical protein